MRTHPARGERENGGVREENENEGAAKAELFPDVSCFQMADFHNDSAALHTVQIRVCESARTAPVHDEEEERLCFLCPLSK